MDRGVSQPSPEPSGSLAPGTLSEADVRKVARLSRLALTSEQVHDYRAKLASVLGYMDRLREVNVDGVEPMSHPGDLFAVLAEDVPGPTLDPKVLQDMAPAAIDGFVAVPKVLGDGANAGGSA